MPLFRGRENKAQIAVSQPVAKAAAAGVPNWSPNMAGPNMIGQYYSYQEGEARNRAMQVPAISRARDLHAAVISAMPLKMYRERWNETRAEIEYQNLAPRTWLRRPDPQLPYETLMAWTFDDLFFFGRAFWYITSKTATPHHLPACPPARSPLKTRSGQSGSRHPTASFSKAAKLTPQTWCSSSHQCKA